MRNVLIPTMPRDTHAIYVHLALKEKGHNSLLWYTADFPTQQSHSFSLDGKNLLWNAQGQNFFVKDQTFDVVWNRRPSLPILYNKLHEDDKKQSQKENFSFFESFWYIIAPDAFWINASENARRANCKILQLKIAMDLNLKIPDTLISNDPNKIKNFISENGKKKTIYKTFYSLAWEASNNNYLSYSTIVTPECLPSDILLQSTPGIFQEKIDKAFELRVTYFGTYPVAVKLCSQEHPDGILDWRAIPHDQLIIEPYNLPVEIHKKCIALMEKLGLSFGCFDFIVTPNNEYFFLEINEQGQFLWIEHRNPSIKMLDTFTEFLINKKKDFEYKKSKKVCSLSEYIEKAQEHKKRAIEQHLMSF